MNAAGGRMPYCEWRARERLDAGKPLLAQVDFRLMAEFDPALAERLI
jgi:hypothetical protein